MLRDETNSGVACLYLGSSQLGYCLLLHLFWQPSCLPWFWCVLVWLVSAFYGIGMRKFIDVFSGTHELSSSSAFVLLWSLVFIFILVAKFCLLWRSSGPVSHREAIPVQAQLIPVFLLVSQLSVATGVVCSYWIVGSIRCSNTKKCFSMYMFCFCSLVHLRCTSGLWQVSMGVPRALLLRTVC